MHLNNMLLIRTPTLIKLFSNWKNHPAATLAVWRIQIFTEKCSCCFLTSNSSLAGKLDISSGQQNLRVLSCVNVQTAFLRDGRSCLCCHFVVEFLLCVLFFFLNAGPSNWNSGSVQAEARREVKSRIQVGCLSTFGCPAYLTKLQC